MSEQLKSALLRGAYNAVGTFLVTWLGALAIGVDMRKAAIAGGLAALAVLGFRGGGEGTLDTSRALAVAEGKREPNPGDIQAQPPASTVVITNPIVTPQTITTSQPVPPVPPVVPKREVPLQ